MFQSNIIMSITRFPGRKDERSVLSECYLRTSRIGNQPRSQRHRVRLQDGFHYPEATTFSGASSICHKHVGVFSGNKSVEVDETQRQTDGRIVSLPRPTCLEPGARARPAGGSRKHPGEKQKERVAPIFSSAFSFCFL